MRDSDSSTSSSSSASSPSSDHDADREQTPEGRLERAVERWRAQAAAGIPFEDRTITICTGVGYPKGTEKYCVHIPDDADPWDEAFGVVEMTWGEFVGEVTSCHESHYPTVEKRTSGWYLAHELTIGKGRWAEEAGPFYFCAPDFDDVPEEAFEEIKRKLSEAGMLFYEIPSYSDINAPRGHVRRRLIIPFACPIGTKEYLEFVNALDHYVGVWKEDAA